MARRKQSDLAWTVPIILIGLYIVHLVQNHYWGQLALIVLLILAIPVWTYVTKVRTKCLVTFTATGLPCQNPTRGIIFGCKGQNHYWVKAFARFGKRQYPADAYPGRRRMREREFSRTGANSGEVLTVRIENDVKHSIMIYTTILGSVCTIVLFVDQFRRWVS